MSIGWTPPDLVTSAAAARHGARGRVLGRFAVPVRGRAFWPLLWAGVVAAELAVIAEIVVADEALPGYRVLFRLTGGVFAACGLIAWRRRPDSRSGLLMVATGAGLLIEPLFAPVDAPA